MLIDVISLCTDPQKNKEHFDHLDPFGNDDYVDIRISKTVQITEVITFLPISMCLVITGTFFIAPNN